MAQRDDCEAILPELKDTIQDAVDEVRYCYPSIGLNDWSSLVARLAGGLAAAGHLSDEAACGALFRRLDGDDDALGAAAVTAAAILPAAVVASGLRLAGIDPQTLVERLKEWHQSRSSVFADRWFGVLASIGEASQNSP